VNKRKTLYPRFNPEQRLEHALLLISFTVLAITGLSQKFADTSLGSMIILLMGGIETTRLIHRTAAILLMLEAIYHGAVVTYKVAVLHLPLTILPSWQDMKDGFHAFGYNLGLVQKGPQMGRYTFGEKAEYWAVIWGTVIMIITGFMLWNPIATTRFLPGQFIPAAKAAHGGEALLAVLSIITWHLYNVHLKVFNKSMFTGQISRHEMEEEHPLELAKLEAGRPEPEPDPVTLQRRRRIFMPIAAIITISLLFGLYLFVTFEQTAIDTVPRQEIEIFTPATPEP
jgi:cytochrome b subunit of formate dehydrogenase